VSTLTVTAGAPTRDRLEQIGLAALVGIVAAMQVSIAAAEILLTIAALCWLAMHLMRGERLQAPAFFWPLAVYGLLTLASAALSLDPAVSVIDCKQLTLFLLVPIIYDLARGPRALTLLTVVLSIGALSAFIGIVEYGLLHYDDLGRRATGTLSHWMTYSGTLMLVMCGSVARILYGTRDRLWAAFVMPALIVALSITFTRSAWVGTATGVGALLMSKDWRLTLLLPLAIGFMVLVAPPSLTSRMVSMFDWNNPTNRDRVAMIQAGSAIVADHPFVGVGPDMISRVYPEYRVVNAVEPNNPHLHNVPMQIAAERGLPALAAWAWFVVSLAAGLVSLMRRGGDRSLAAAGIGAVVAMLAAGLFEYNFGDSEFLMLFLVLVSLPFAAAREGAS
jgi:O-antigen ligase